MNYNKPSNPLRHTNKQFREEELVRQGDKKKLAVSPPSHFLCAAKLHDSWREAAPFVLSSRDWFFKKKICQLSVGPFALEVVSLRPNPTSSAHWTQSATYFPTNFTNFSWRASFLKAPRDLQCSSYLSHMTRRWRETLTWRFQTCLRRYFPEVRSSLN